MTWKFISSLTLACMATSYTVVMIKDNPVLLTKGLSGSSKYKATNNTLSSQKFLVGFYDLYNES